jgi:hypothetical protein
VTNEDSLPATGLSPLQKMIAEGRVALPTRSLEDLPYPVEGPSLTAALEESRNSDNR